MQFHIGQLVCHNYGPLCIGVVIGTITEHNRLYYSIKWFAYEMITDHDPNFISSYE